MPQRESESVPPSAPLTLQSSRGEQVPETPSSSFPLTETRRRLIAIALVVLAVVHVVFPGLAIDGVFLGLLAFSGLVMLFDIETVEWLGIRAKRRELKEELQRVKEVAVSDAPAKAAPPPSQITAQPDSPAGLPTDHKPALDLTPPVDQTERLFWAVEQARVELILLAGNTGRLKARRSWDSYRIPELARTLAEPGILPAELLSALDNVVAQRNELAHGRFGPRVLTASASELALELLVKLRQIPRNYNRVRVYPVELFGDQSLTTKRPFPGVQIEQLDAEGRTLVVQVFPTRVAYMPGRFVTWEWEFEDSPDEEAWFVDPSTKRPTLAYAASAWFAGREYPEQWGIEYRVGGPMRV